MCAKSIYSREGPREGAIFQGCLARRTGLQRAVVVELAGNKTLLARVQEEYKKIDLTLVCADGTKVEIPGAARNCCMPEV